MICFTFPDIIPFKHIYKLLRANAVTVPDNIYAIIAIKLIKKFIIMCRNDVKSLLASDFIEINPETTQVTWKDKRYNGQWHELRQQIERGYVTYSQDKLLLWMMPIEVFEAFESVTILTYMFEGQYLYCYCQLNDIAIDYIGVRHIDGLNYEFTDKMVAPRITLPTIHLYSGHKLNTIGDDRLALSHSWFSKSDPKLIRKLANNTVNFFRHKCDAPANYRFWSAPSAFKDVIAIFIFQVHRLDATLERIAMQHFHHVMMK